MVQSGIEWYRSMLSNIYYIVFAASIVDWNRIPLLLNKRLLVRFHELFI